MPYKNSLLLSLIIFCFSLKTSAQTNVVYDTVNVFYSRPMHKVEIYGYDLKQQGKAEEITVELARSVFVEQNFNLIRIPMYNWAHGDDGIINDFSDYGKIVNALLKIKRACDENEHPYPAIYISPKITPDLNENEWGHFLDKSGLVDVQKYYHGVVKVIEYYQVKTGLTIEYFAPSCEHSINQLPPDRFMQLFKLFKKNKLKVKLVAGETVSVGPYNLEDGINRSVEYWPLLKTRKIIKSTHNKNARWKSEAPGIKADWNGESIGPGNLFKHMVEVNQTYYIGECRGIIFWGSAINKIELRAGDFRREIVELADNRLLLVKKAGANSKSAAIAYKTSRKEIKFFISASTDALIILDRPIKNYPSGVFKIDDYTLLIKKTKSDDYFSGVITLE